MGYTMLTGFVRAAIFLTPYAKTIAVSSSLIAIAVIGTGLGSTLLLAMKKERIYPSQSLRYLQVSALRNGIVYNTSYQNTICSLRVAHCPFFNSNKRCGDTAIPRLESVCIYIYIYIFIVISYFRKVHNYLKTVSVARQPQEQYY